MYYLFLLYLFLNKKKIEIEIFINIVIILIHIITYKMFNPDFKNEKVNYEMIHTSIKSLTCIIMFFGIYATYKFLSIVIKIIFKNIIIIEYKWLDIYIMVSIVVTALIIFITFKGLADELNNIFIKLNDSIIEKDKKIKELEEKVVTNNIKIGKLEHENMEISKLLDENIDNLIINLSIEDNSKTKK